MVNLPLNPTLDQLPAGTKCPAVIAHNKDVTGSQKDLMTMVMVVMMAMMMMMMMS